MDVDIGLARGSARFLLPRRPARFDHDELRMTHPLRRRA
jgi:hypothetical protein